MSDKYPRTFHLPWSPGATSDDKRLDSAKHFVGIPLVITEKLDGGNLCITKREVYARSHSTPVQGKMYSFAKTAQSIIGPHLDDGVSVFFEYCAWVHSIAYTDLPSYLLMIGARDDGETAGEESWWYNWDMPDSLNVVGLAAELQMKTGFNIPTVPDLWQGTVKSVEDLEAITTQFATQKSVYGPDREGIVVRTAQGFASFDRSVAKWVRKDHVTSDEHWMNGPLKAQGLKK